jgi:hypothetical protein
MSSPLNTGSMSNRPSILRTASSASSVTGDAVQFGAHRPARHSMSASRRTYGGRGSERRPRSSTRDFGLVRTACRISQRDQQASCPNSKISWYSRWLPARSASGPSPDLAARRVRQRRQLQNAKRVGIVSMAPGDFGNLGTILLAPPDNPALLFERNGPTPASWRSCTFIFFLRQGRS